MGHTQGISSLVTKPAEKNRNFKNHGAGEVTYNVARNSRWLYGKDSLDKHLSSYSAEI